MTASKEKKKQLKKRALEAKIALPEGVSAGLENNIISLKGPAGEVKRRLVYPGIVVKLADKNISVSAKNTTARSKKIVFTFQSHIKNMVKGVEEGYQYILKICSGHFPMTVAVQGEQLIIKNFVGEKMSRTVQIPQGVKVKVEGDKVVINSPDKELAGMTASRIEEKTKRRAFDPRIFQDGVYLIEKGGKKI